MRLDRRPEVDQVRSGVCERHAGFSSTGQSVKDSTFIDALQVAQILTEVELCRVTLRRRHGQSSEVTTDRKVIFLKSSDVPFQSRTL